jgi:cytochrome P450
VQQYLGPVQRFSRRRQAAGTEQLVPVAGTGSGADHVRQRTLVAKYFLDQHGRRRIFFGRVGAALYRIR